MGRRVQFSTSKRFKTDEELLAYLESRFGPGNVKRLDNAENLIGQRIFHEFEIAAPSISGTVTFCEGPFGDGQPLAGWEGHPPAGLDLWTWRGYNRLYRD